MAPQGTKTSTKALKVIRRPLPDSKGFIRPLPTYEMKGELTAQINAWINAFGLNGENEITPNKVEHLFDRLLVKLPKDFFEKDCDWSIIKEPYVKHALYQVLKVKYWESRKNCVQHNVKHTYRIAKRLEQNANRKNDDERYDLLLRNPNFLTKALKERREELTGAEKLNFNEI
jgi:hypothetical protein